MQRELWLSRFDDYLTLRGFSPRTIEGRLQNLGQFLDFLQAEGVQSVTELTRDVLESYRNQLYERRYRQRRLCLSTQQGKLGAIKAFTRFLAQLGYLPLDPGLGLELPRAQRPLPRVILSETEVLLLLAAPNVSAPRGLRDRAMLELLYASGIRNSELLALRLGEVDIHRYELRIVRGKGGKSRLLPLGRQAARWLEQYLAKARPQLLTRPEENHVFLSCRGRPLERMSLAKLVRQHARAAGLAKTVTPHVLRHSCATHMLRRGAGLRHLQDLLGHASPLVTERYTKVELSDLQEALRRFHPRERKENRP